ncbi:MAG TPA: serine/threonine-protein kinase [Candidatus Polarisedimenticolaceae bacterium]|nr:serine/threonine-protein kinase [Candidatus Polarisedimenticolaceae bacterium]
MKLASCPSCTAQLPEDSRFCPRCGSAVEPAPLRADGPTRTVLDRTPASPSVTPRRTDVTSAGRLAASDSGLAARFVAGQVLLERYRILGLIGRGGMGEVYRADDLKLDQPVALKFLPAAFSEDRGRLDRFYGEVRIARQVSHPNVARVYDVGEIEGQTFLSMEYIDGEDLGTLLRRIGRFPGERAVQISREICAGLAAAHDRGVLHRDLKPANVMIDGRGRARITDFGLASVVGEQVPGDVRSGTPHYMAPEQLEGREVSVRSDLYALGLVLYEIFTGRRARDAGSMAELLRMQASTPVNPSSFVADLDPLVENVILQCLDPDPENRPISALAVAAALPGGDPLAAALAAGEMPSPEAVAAAGGAGAMRPAVAAACVAFVVLGMVVVAALAPRASLLARLGAGRPPDVLVDRAQEIAHRLGHSGDAADRAWCYGTFGDVWDWIKDEEHPERRALLRPGGPTLLHFWYRESPTAFDPRNWGSVVTTDDPPLTLGGMLRLQLDLQGRLRSYISIPKRELGEAPRALPVDWRPALDAAGLDQVTLTPSAPRWTPPVFADTRAAWEGSWPGSDLPLRVEAAGLGGRVVYFVVAGPWAQPDAPGVGQPKGKQRAALILNVFFLVGALTAACWVARSNLKAGRGDRRGALRVGLGITAITALATWIEANHVPDVVTEWVTLQEALAFGLFFGGFVWVLYLALEPFVRRHAPNSLIGWTRLVQGRWRDPRVGRDLVAGAVAGAALLACLSLTYLVADLLHLVSPEPYRTALPTLLGARYIVAVLLSIPLSATASALVLLFFFSLGYLGIQSPWTGRAIFFTITAVMTYLFRGGGNPALTAAFALVGATILTTIYARFGVLAAFAMQVFSQWSLPLTLDLSVWYAPTMLAATAVLLALVALAAWTAVGGALRRVGG